MYFAPRNSIDIKFSQLDRDIKTSSIDYMNQKIESISTKGKNALNIIMIDEMCPSPIGKANKRVTNE